MNEVVIKIVQGSVVTQNVLDGLTINHVAEFKPLCPKSIMLFCLLARGQVSDRFVGIR